MSLTSDQIQEIEDKKKKAIAEFDAQIAKLQSLGKAKEDFSALVQKYEYPNATDFLAALGYELKVKRAPKSKSTPVASTGSGKGGRKPSYGQGEIDLVKAIKAKDTKKSATDITELYNNSRGDLKKLKYQQVLTILKG